MPLVNCEVNLILTWSSTCVITNSTGAGRFAITDTKIHIPVANLLTQDNSKLLQQYNQNPIFKEQLIGTNINQIQKHIHKTDI